MHFIYFRSNAPCSLLFVLIFASLRTIAPRALLFVPCSLFFVPCSYLRFAMNDRSACFVLCSLFLSSLRYERSLRVLCSLLLAPCPLFLFSFLSLRPNHSGNSPRGLHLHLRLHLHLHLSSSLCCSSLIIKLFRASHSRACYARQYTHHPKTGAKLQKIFHICK